MSELADTLLRDIFDNHRTFLPGPRCDRQQVLDNFGTPVLYGGLDLEETMLLQSMLPAETTRLWIQPLDKGLSEAKAFQVRYRADDIDSKPYVVKLGPLRKIDREARAVNELVATTILGIGQAVTRRGEKLGLVAQDFASLSEGSKLHSLRERVTDADDGPELLSRLLHERLGPWYEGRSTVKPFIFRDLFQNYLTKAPDLNDGFPPPWEQLFDFIATSYGCSWDNVAAAIDLSLEYSESLPATVIHGDLHTQNVLVDDLGNCWPIDFAWTRRDSSVLLDLVMLECSLKFLALPARGDLHHLLGIEHSLAAFQTPTPSSHVPYASEINRVVRCVETVREYGLDRGISEHCYLMGLILMTLAMTTHPGLNTPYVISSLQIMSGRLLEGS